MRFIQKIVVVGTLISTLCYAQEGVDPAYLQQYYQQVASQAGRAAAGAKQDATPIFEPNSDVSPQYVQPGQQLRVRAQQQHQQAQAYVAPQVRQYVQQPQAHQQVQYVQQPQAAPKATLLRQPPPSYAAPEGKLNKESPEDYDPNPSYQFGFDVKDDEFTNYQNRKESRDGNVITGSYSVVDADGFIRTVKYTADPKEGFKAEVIREPTDIVVKVPTPAPQSADQYLRQVSPQRFPSQPAPQAKPSPQQYQYHQ
ncbi:cuticle protein 21 isoform X3 [Hermetia illucens]|uniref:cuticle protein 21 isoform X3 n=1 Tax=Hermetia illucens TaxID=343691 RepID=UPI0018CC29AE|nr:cuticle protein 21 isoform X3 [Hermetia illucens]